MCRWVDWWSRGGCVMVGCWVRVRVRDQNPSIYSTLRIFCKFLCLFDTGRCLSDAESMGYYCEVLLVFEYLFSFRSYWSSKWFKQITLVGKYVSDCSKFLQVVSLIYVHVFRIIKCINPRGSHWIISNPSYN